ncbi:short-chain dehydrogenase [Aspergillus terreus]|uniref:Short-chain dehydrogenase n=1 Tax=Aspergillus terreus TaxID=33178 RepID=A0A5M3YTM6_ASPTE|nr:hypothetical protein ATETN484_0004001600 [Aspergillus terreus]GFF12906.1 short-chain dehydrogenase [Aspergillus terreus]
MLMLFNYINRSWGRLPPSKKAVIIGGTHGICLATAQLLLQQDVQILVTGRSSQPIDTAKRELGSNDRVVPCDITSLKDITELVHQVEAYFGPGEQIDLLFINAGYAHLDAFTDVTEETFHRTFSTNVFGSFFVAQRLVPFIRQGSAVVFTTSVANKKGIPVMSVYSASKAAMHSLVQTLAAELAGRKIRVNAFSPGFIKTPTMGVAGTPAEAMAAFEEEGVRTTPLDRIGRAEENAKAVAFLAFDATFTTGTELVVDGGLVSLQKAGH